MSFPTRTGRRTAGVAPTGAPPVPATTTTKEDR